MFRPYMWVIFRLCFDLQSSYTRCVGCSLRVLGVTISPCFYIGYHDQGLLQVDCHSLSVYTCHSRFLYLCYGYVTINMNKTPTDATVCTYLYTAKLFYMFRVSQHPSSVVLKTVTAASRTGHNTSAATSLQRGLNGTASRSDHVGGE